MAKAVQVVILAREAGLELELSDVPVESLVPAELESGTPAEFLQQLSQFDDDMAKRAKAAADKVHPLRLLAELLKTSSSAACSSCLLRHSQTPGSKPVYCVYRVRI